jgi:hypothetical protein
MSLEFAIPGRKGMLKSRAFVANEIVHPGLTAKEAPAFLIS